MNLKRFFYTILVYGLFTLLVGCGNTFVSKKVSNYDDSKNSGYYLSLANSSSGSTKTDWQLLAVRALIKENNFSLANELLSKLPSTLSAEQQTDKLLSQGEIATKTGRSFSLSELSVQGMTNSQLYRYYTIKLALDGKKKDINAQAHDYMELANNAQDRQKRQVINDTWSFLSKLSSDQIRAILVYENETILRGWVDLTYAYKSNSQAPATQEDDTPEIIADKAQRQKDSLKQAINNWLMQYPQHPAKEILTVLTGEQMLSVDNVDAKKVALLLPLNGSSRIFGETIRQGYWDAIKYYPHEPQQNVVVLDTSTASMDSLIQQAQEQNVELIVGPLLKDEVNKIKQIAPSIPVLALNKVDNSPTSAKKMCYFALSPEDEAKDAAEHIYAQNKYRPLLLVPQNDLGQRVAQSFAKQWLQLSGNSSQAYVQYFGNAKSLSANMNHNSGIRLTGDPILINGMSSDSTLPTGEAEGFDSVYIYASYDELTLIKPMLDMGASKSLGNTPSSITLYSSSKSHIVNASKDFYYDMNQTQYADIPMIVNEPNSSITIPSNIQKDYSLTRLYAMGIDAWRLANRYNQLDSHQTNFLDGMTGKLSTTDQCEITRSLSWQQYTYGEDPTTPKSE